MAKFAPSQIKNICIVGHGDSGKTTLADAMLFKSGAVSRQGSVKDKTSVFDYDDLEKDKGHSIDSAIARCEWDGNLINVIDTPGYPDYIGDAVGAIAASDGVAICVNGVNGVQVNTRRVMRVAEKLDKARMIVVTKCDMNDIDIEAVIEDIRTWFGEACIPITLPPGDRTRLRTADAIAAYRRRGNRKGQEVLSGLCGISRRSRRRDYDSLFGRRGH